jgi:H+/gluconate symporter-like permease
MKIIRIIIGMMKWLNDAISVIAIIVLIIIAGGTVSPELMVLAAGTGGVFGSHINDS